MRADRRLDVAEQLLAKARATTFDGERAAFAEGALDQLDAFLGSLGSDPDPSERPTLTLPIRSGESDPQDVQIIDLRGAQVRTAADAYTASSRPRPSGRIIDLAL